MPAVSRINDEIVYAENRHIMEEDVGYNSPVYELDVLGGTYTVVIGKPKYTYSQSKNVVYFPIYAVSGHTIRSQIGVFEFESSKLLNAFRGGELDLARLSEPVLFDFATSAYLAKTDAFASVFDRLPEKRGESESPKSATIEPILEHEQEEDMFRIQSKNKKSATKTDAEAAISAGIFEKGPREDLAKLDEETQEDSDRAKTEYVESVKNTWVEKYFKNNNYRIHENEGSGDCFFAVLRDAFAQIGQKTSVEKLRAALANEMTDSVFQEYRSLFLGFMDEIRSLEREMAQIKKTIDEYKKRVKTTKTSSAADTQMLIEESKRLAEEYKVLSEKKKETEQLQTNYAGHMKDVDTLDKMRKYIQTSSYWADPWAISTLERILNVKMLILSETAFESGDLQGVIQCGEVAKEIQERKVFNPDFYVITSYSGNHYRLISYKSHKILKFGEVPFDLKAAVLNKCMEKNAGAFYVIQDFRNLKSKYGIDEDEGQPDDTRDIQGANELFDPDVVFVFYAKSDKSHKPGQGEGENMPKAKAAEYAQLSTKAQLDWRKKLDDDWDKTPIRIDGKQWTSVTHYVLGARYKKGHPDLYHLFSLDSKEAGSLPDELKDLATSVKSARAFKGVKTTSEEPTKKAKQPANKVKPVAPDLDYDEEKERETALAAKFGESNMDLSTTLRLTKSALLMHKGKTGVPMEPDFALMNVRANLLSK